MAQKTVASDGGNEQNAGGEKVSAENFIKSLLIRCKSEITEANDGVFSFY